MSAVHYESQDADIKKAAALLKELVDSGGMSGGVHTRC
jgi:hypothetical protein